MEEHTIDFRDLLRIAQSHKRRLLSLIVATIIFSGIIAFCLPKKFESTALIQVKTQQPGTGISMQGAAALAFLAGNLSTPTNAYVEMLQTRSVLDAVVAQVEMPDNEREDLVLDDFIKQYLRIENIKKTDLIELTAIGRSPEEAQFIAKAVVDSFQEHLTRLNQSDNSFMLQFLKERLAVAKTEMEQAEKQLLLFSQQEKVYAPTEQASAFLKQMMAYDQQLAQFQVQVENNEAKLRAVMDQIGKQNSAIEKYQFADHPTIASFRAKIVEKQMALFNQEQLYTDKHPNVIRLRSEIEELNKQLRQQVTALIEAGTSPLNAVHANLLAEKTTTEVGLSVAKASYDGLKKMQTENEEISSKGITYVSLERQRRISTEVYGVLTRQYEEYRVKAVMESMDLQIVDAPQLPKKKSGPKRVLITAVGGILGIMIAFIFVMTIYLRNNPNRKNA